MAIFPKLCLAGLVLLPAAAQLRLRDDAWLSNDAAQYLSVARNILAGQGVQTSIVYYPQHHQIGRVPTPQTVFPPGFPVLIALVATTGLPVRFAAFLLCLVAFGSSTMLLYGIARRSGESEGSSLLVAGLWAFLITGWLLVVRLTSEALFVFFTLLGLRLLQEAGPGRMWPYMATGAAATLAFSVRYAGIFYMASLGLFLLYRWLVPPRSVSLRPLILACALPLATVVLLFARNHVLTADVKGGNDHRVHQPWGEVMLDFIYGIESVVGFEWTGLTRGRRPEMIMAGGLAVLAFLLLGRGRAAPAARGRSSLEALYSAFYLGVSVVLLAWLQQRHGVGVSDRLLLPLAPFALLLVAGMTLPGREHARGVVLGVSALTLAAVFVAGQKEVYAHAWTEPRREIVPTMLEALAEDPTVGERLREEARRPILANEPQLAGEVLAQPVLGLPSFDDTPIVWDDPAVRGIVERFEVRYVLFFPTILRFGANANQPFFASLHAGAVPPWLTPVSSTPRIRLYRVEPPAPGEGQRGSSPRGQ